MIKYLLFGIIFIAAAIGILTYVRSPGEGASPVATLATSTAPGTRTYRNTKYGFEFRYPEDWKFEENTFYGPFSKFNLVGSPAIGGHLPDPIVINIVTPDFAEHAFSGFEKTTSSATVAGVRGVQYEYQYEGLPEVAIVLPFGQYRMLLGVKKQYENVFHQILASLKFLK